MTEELSNEAIKLLERVKRKPLELYWGRNGFCPSYLPSGVKRKHYDELLGSGLVEIKMARLKQKDKI